MRAPEEAVDLIRETDEMGPHEGSLSEIESSHPIRCEQFEPALCALVCSETPPILLFREHLHAGADDLKRLIDSIPEKSGAEDGVPVNDPLPCFSERRDVEVCPEGAAELIDINP